MPAAVKHCLASLGQHCPPWYFPHRAPSEASLGLGLTRLGLYSVNLGWACYCELVIGSAPMQQLNGGD